MGATIRNIVLLGGLIIGAMGFMNAYHTWYAFSSKIEQQNLSTLKMRRWTTAYSELQPINEQWDQAFNRLTGVVDHLAIYSAMGISEYGLSVDPDSLSVRQTADDRLSEEYKIGLYPICIGSKHGALEVQAKSLPRLLEGLKGLANEPDVRLGKIILDTKQPDVVKVFDYCVLVQA